MLTEDRRSPWAQDIKWSLPKLNPDATWMPGAWKEWEQSHALLVPIVKEPGLYVSNRPWLTGHFKPRVFEAEIGDHPSITRWNNAPHGDFAAQKVRLLNELTLDEAIAALKA